ncbi:MAG: Crp/Fnr family transcriptional regulator [Clostridium sp.]|uniref:Crp/Fnr family transcriptional regulator n=1 Tax=Clostridium sp. TaxID=1506 RepID=UPI003F381018
MAETCICKDCNGGKSLCARNVSIFASLTDKELKDIVSTAVRREYIKGETICREGETLDNLLLIRDGKIKISKVTKDGKEQILHILATGDFLGEANLFNDEASRFTVTAITNVKICIISKENLEDILLKNPRIALKIIKEISKKLSETEDLAKVLATRDVESRVASMLVEFSVKYGKEIDNETLIQLPINREDMANYCGVTRETISRKLSKFESEKIITVKGNKVIIVTNLEKLRGLSE